MNLARAGMLALLFCAGMANANCNAPLGAVAANVRAKWSAPKVSWWRWWRAREPRFDQFVETKSLLAGDSLRPVGDATVVPFVRQSRARGFAELRRATRLGEARSFVFIPKLEAWIDDSIVFADARSVFRYTRLDRALDAAFGPIERYHVNATQEGGASIVFDALPSVSDFECLLGSCRCDPGRPEIIGPDFLAHELGVTVFLARSIGTRDGRARLPEVPRYGTARIVNEKMANRSPEARVRMILRNAGAESWVWPDCSESDAAGPAEYRFSFVPWGELLTE